MINSEYVALGGLLIALVGMITGFILQRDNKKIRDLERDNKKFKNRLMKALIAIKGYQLIETKQAKELDKKLSVYRREMRDEFTEYFPTDFLGPKNIDEMITELKDLK